MYEYDVSKYSSFVNYLKNNKVNKQKFSTLHTENKHFPTIWGFFKNANINRDKQHVVETLLESIKNIVNTYGFDYRNIYVVLCKN